MAATATEKWSQKFKSISFQSPTATRLWDVIGASSEADAIAAVSVSIGDDYPGDTLLHCSDVGATRKGFGVWEVIATYQVGNFTVLQTDPLSEPPIIQWDPILESDAFDRDINSNPICNANFDAFDPAPQRKYHHWMLTIIKNRSFFDLATLSPFQNTCNDASFTLTEPNGHTNTVATECAFVASVAPAAAYKTTDKYVPIKTQIEIYFKNDGSSTAYPFRTRLLNEGMNGFFVDPTDSTTKMGQFCTSRGDLVSRNVRLFADGTPYDENLMVRNNDVIAAPVANADAPDWPTWESIGDVATYAIFKTYKLSTFSSLFTALGL